MGPEEKMKQRVLRRKGRASRRRIWEKCLAETMKDRRSGGL